MVIQNRPPRAALPFALPDALDQRCVVPPHPDLHDKIRESMRKASVKLSDLVPAGALQLPPASRPGLDDGLIIPGSYFPIGTPVALVKSAAADRAPLRGIVRVVVVLVDFSDKVMVQTAAHFNDLFFSTGVIATGSVREYYQEVTNGLVQLQGQVVGPYRMPNTLAHYANGSSGLGAAPNARDMARDAVIAADAAVNFGPFDNDGNGFVDAFIVIHAGPGGEVTRATSGRTSGSCRVPRMPRTGSRSTATSRCLRTRRSASVPTSSAISCSASRTCTTRTTRRPGSATGA